ncbi:MAG: cytochrome oxidase assembly protein, partial [Nitrosopumilales archaeon CG15_BIG_FIL_POST_REV_8_21_14_020_33_23]
HAVLVAIHLGVGILLFSMVLLTTLFAFRIAKKPIESTV